MTAPEHGTEREPRTRSAWREPMVWLIAAFPVAAVIATVALLVTATRSSGTTDSVADNVRRTAQIQVSDFGPDAQARQLRLSAIVRIDKGVLTVLPVEGEFVRTAPLTVALHHPARETLDRSLVLQPSDTGWQAPARLDLSHDWNVQLGPADGVWRLQGRLIAGQQAAYLHPALRGD